MRRLLLALPFTLLPLAAVQAADHAHDQEHEVHGSLDAHKHGVAQLNVVLDDQALELELESPAMNLLGFEHAAKSDADKAKVATVHNQLQDPLALFGLNAGDCTVAKQALESPLFATQEKPHAHGHQHKHKEQHDDHDSEHSEIHAHYQLDCKSPGELKQLNLGELFKRFPTTEKIQVQLIGPNGQQGLELTPAQPTLSF